MKLPLGFLLGAAVGGYVMYSMSPDQRERTASTAANLTEKVKNSGPAQAVADNVSQVAGTASDRVSDAVDRAGDAATEAVAKNGDAADVETTISGPDAEARAD